MKKLAFAATGLVVGLLALTVTPVSLASVDGLGKAPIDPQLVIVDQSKHAYTVFIAIPRDLPESRLENLRSEVAQRNGIKLMTWEKFIENRKRINHTRILKDEYRGSRALDGVIQLIRGAPGLPIGLTWNGGIALTRLDYQHAEATYAQYKNDPEEYERTRNRDPRLDPVNPKGHLGPLLGW